jgi:hypothetical protein
MQIQYTTNAQYTMYVNHPEKTLKGNFATSDGECPDQVHSDQMVFRTVRREAGPHERQPKTLKTKLTQGGPSSSSQLRSDLMARREAGHCER